MQDNIQVTVAVNAVLVWLMQYLKGSKYFPWLTTETAAANKIASAILAGLASAGMVFTLAHTGAGGAGTITITYAGLTISNLAHFAAQFVANYATQKTFYKAWTGLSAPSAAPALPAEPEQPKQP